MVSALPISEFQPDHEALSCPSCREEFGLFLRRHHCRFCGLVFCDACSQGRIQTDNPDDAGASLLAYALGGPPAHRACDGCFDWHQQQQQTLAAVQQASQTLLRNHPSGDVTAPPAFSAPVTPTVGARPGMPLGAAAAPDQDWETCSVYTDVTTASTTAGRRRRSSRKTTGKRRSRRDIIRRGSNPNPTPPGKIDEGGAAAVEPAAPTEPSAATSAVNEAKRLSRQLREAALTRDWQAIEGLLRQAGRMHVNQALLSASGLGRTVGGLCKTSDQAVAYLSKELIAKWKAAVDEEKVKKGRQLQPDAAVTDPVSC